MLANYKGFLILIYVLFTASACSIFPPATPTATPETPVAVEPVASKEKKTIVDDKCKSDDKISLLAPNYEYCLAHPYGYYAYTIENEPNTFIVRTGDAVLNMNPDEETPESANLPSSVFLKIRRVDNAEEKDLLNFIAAEAKVAHDDLSPWTISGESAYIAKRHLEKTVIYYIYTKHDEVYYILEFSTQTTDNTAVSISDDSTCADQLEKLLFTVSETFTFLE